MKEKRPIKLELLIGTVIALVLVAGLAVTLAFAADMKEKYNTHLDNLYKKSFIEAMDSIDDIEIKLSKVSISEGSQTQKTLLSEIWMNAEIAKNNLAQLSGKDSNMEKIIQFLNQMGDYCHCLSKKLPDDPLTDEEKDKLESLYKVVQSLKASFKEVDEGLRGDATFVGRLDEGIQMLGDCYEHFNNDSNIDYPEMIYDGPFSDATAIREAKYLNSLPKVTQEAAEARAREIFKDAKEIAFVEKTMGSIPSFVFSVATEEGEGLAQISEQGGKLVLYTSSHDKGGAEIDIEEATEKAEEVLVTMGYENLKLVWVTPGEGAVYLNYIFFHDDILYYPDFVKLKVGDDGCVLAFDATGYAYNHIDRSLDPPSATPEQAAEKVSKKLTIVETRTVVIPTKWNTEIFAYEFFCEREDEEFYVYIDANTLEEVEIMKVVNNMVV
jgi:germination protein YpeB